MNQEWRKTEDSVRLWRIYLTEEGEQRQGRLYDLSALLSRVSVLEVDRGHRQGAPHARQDLVRAHGSGDATRPPC